MMAMANDKPAPTWRNFVAWSAAGAIVYVLAVWGATAFLRGDLIDVILRSTRVAAQLGLGLLLSMAVVGFTSRKRPVNVRNLGKFMLQNAVALILFLLAVRGFLAAAHAGILGAIGISEWAAIVTGTVLVVFAILGTFVLASARAGANLIHDEVAADDLRERGRMFLCSFLWMAACGVLLIALGLAGSEGLLPPTPALAVTLILISALALLGIAVWRLSDELARTLSREAGNMAFYLIVALGGGWALLAHLGLAAAPAPLDWLTLLTVLMFAASFIVVGRRGLLN